jgi:hypothetical protein
MAWMESGLLVDCPEQKTDNVAAPGSASRFTYDQALSVLVILINSV